MICIRLKRTKDIAYFRMTLECTALPHTILSPQSLMIHKQKQIPQLLYQLAHFPCLLKLPVNHKRKQKHRDLTVKIEEFPALNC